MSFYIQKFSCISIWIKGCVFYKVQKSNSLPTSISIKFQHIQSLSSSLPTSIGIKFQHIQSLSSSLPTSISIRFQHIQSLSSSLPTSISIKFQHIQSLSSSLPTSISIKFQHIQSLWYGLKNCWKWRKNKEQVKRPFLDSHHQLFHQPTAFKPVSQKPWALISHIFMLPEFMVT